MLSVRAFLVTAVLGIIVTASVCAQTSPSGQSPTQQPTQPDKPVEPVKPEGENKTLDEPPAPPVVAGTANNAPLTGANEPPLGIFSSRSFVVPALEYYGQLDSNGSNTPFGRFAAINSVLGALSLQKVGRTSQLNLDYMLGRSFSNEGDAFNSTINDLNASYLWSRGRWDGFVVNKLLYSSESSFLGGIAPFEYMGPESIAGLATGPVVLRNSFLPGQGIFTNVGPRLSDALVAQVNNHLSRRTFFTVVGNYNTLHFYDSPLINSSAAGFQTGIGFQRTRQDAIAIVYRYNDLWFSGFPTSIHDNVVELAYQRQVAERWRFQAGAGPELTYIHAPNQNLTTTSDSTRVSWAADVALNYQMRRTGLTFGYDHFLTNGGGVFLGSIRDGVFGSANRELSRLWRVTVSASYARNKNLIPFPSSITGVFAPANAHFNSVYGGFELHRRVARDSELFFGYLGRYQTSNYAACQPGTEFCVGSHLVGHQFNFGFLWRVRPIPIG
jgi:hypothetical protein